ncbi:Ig-like domain-containing protein [Streptomyces sp. G-G2]|uniref:Ig-like domain-containing protein n=1 Tax=Streptomyces sp. G-G2 TaxID=3046201 RepID=UPI0024BAFD60|nr:Ig-like domain-containing protein [Streptomyces sp. G-G2]MDJ0386270.1 Ig-like domain-containing protein [Streptomyces sp. G-G2]
MSNTVLRPSAAGKALVVGALLALLVPGMAYANTVGATVKTPGVTVGPGSTFSEISTHADCGTGPISGGGIDQAIGTGTVSNGNHVNGTGPSPDGSTEYTGSTGVVGTDVTHWLGIGGSGGAVDSAFSTTPYAMCFTSSLITHTQVVMNKIAGPAAASTVGLVTATCPAGTRLLGGGARTTPASVGSLKPIASFPTFNNAGHDYGQKAAADGESNPDSWSAVGWNGAQGGNGGGGGGGGYFGGAGGSGGGNPGNLYGAGGGGGSGYAAPSATEVSLVSGAGHGAGRAVVPFRYGTTTTLTADTTTPLFGHAVALTATVAPAGPAPTGPGGTVTFSDGPTELATVPVEDGRARAATGVLQPGRHRITAAYSGDPGSPRGARPRRRPRWPSGSARPASRRRATAR